MTLIDQISDALGASGTLGDLASTLGASTADTDSLLSAGLPAVLGGLGAQAGGDGLSALMVLLKDDAGSFADSLGSFFSRGDKTGLASKLVGSLFGSQRSAIEGHIADSSGGALSLVSKFLPMLAPAVLSYLGKIVEDEELDADGLGEQLAAVGADGPLGDLLVAQTDADRAGFVTGLTAFSEAGGLAALVPVAAPASAAKVGTAAAAGASGAGAGGGAAQNLASPADDRDRNGLGWLPAILLLIVGLITGLVLWQCTRDANNVEPVVVEAEGEAMTEPAETPEPTAVPEPAATAEPAPEPTATAEPTPVPAVTIADLALATPELSTLVGIASDLDLVALLADPDAGPFTVFAPTNDAFASAEAVLARLDGDQTRTAVTFHVVEGVITSDQLTPGATFQTVAGETLTVGDDGTLTGGVRVTTADIEADNGVVHIVENVLVPGSIQRALAAEDVNEAFVLNPIQFDTGSADILAASVPTLDQAIETLTSLPAGTKFEVQGHTDTQGDEALNQQLSDDRAASVVAYLVDGGVDSDMLDPRR